MVKFDHGGLERMLVVETITKICRYYFVEGREETSERFPGIWALMLEISMARWSEPLQPPSVPTGPENKDVPDHKIVNRQPEIVN